MDERQELSELEKPLTKGDFLIFQYDVRKDIYLAMGFVIGSMTLFTLFTGIYKLVTGAKYFGVDHFILAAICFFFSRASFQHWNDIRKKIKTIEEQTQKT
jgi:hypothetical protein